MEGSEAERELCRTLFAVLGHASVGGRVPASRELRDALTKLESRLSRVLCRTGFGREEILDGIEPIAAVKTGANELALLGLCHLIADQTAVPLSLRVRLTAEGDEIASFEYGIGAKGASGMRRNASLGCTANRIYVLDGWMEPERWPRMLNWAYEATHGPRPD